ncbi:hypothetical protein O1611_g9217 [Lasiodiplodia mahajangana]|uniref:Uncharacterized protein n=1 Tax=Lasiodiplodia mahajangana TaxID=1108764 RepID=A0ACC2JBA1_9PEZI|nr:hypothetical protein O1611_g9217 [Lasiodiplodia mahajangana]
MCALATDEYVRFEINGAVFSLPSETCSSLKMSGSLTAHGRSNYVKAGTKILLKRSPDFSLPSPPQAPPTSSKRTSSDATAAAELSDYPSSIYTADGPYKLPFPGCDERVYTFRPLDCQAAVAQLEIYRKLRAIAPPRRWANLAGEVVKGGRVGEVEDPEVCLGKALTGPFPQLPNNVVCWHIDVLESEVTRNFRGKDEAAHMDGDPVHQWIRYPSQELQDVGRKRHFRAGFSIVASWKEIDMTEEEEARKAGFIGMSIAVDGHSRRAFAVVGFKFPLVSKVSLFMLMATGRKGRNERGGMMRMQVPTATNKEVSLNGVSVSQIDFTWSRCTASNPGCVAARSSFDSDTWTSVVTTHRHQGSATQLDTVLHACMVKDNDPLMSSRRSSRQAPALLRESTSVGQPRGEKLTIRVGESSENLVAISTNTSQIPVDADSRCVICYDHYKEGEEVWQAQPCEHLFHFACIDEASISYFKFRPN